uniref:Uncharacterized protein n=1 Tax=Rhizophora mucronata TaxID=61149 RepID=A0A2P2PID0_RHIMU
MVFVWAIKYWSHVYPISCLQKAKRPWQFSAHAGL